MNLPDAPDHRDRALDALLRAQAAPPLADAGFTAGTMRAIARAERERAPRRVPRRAPAAPREIARALAGEQRRHAAQARLWHWAIAGMLVGVLLLVAAIVVAPAGSPADTLAALPSWFPAWSLLAAGALWYAWQEFRAD